MFREMRRGKQSLSMEDIVAVMDRGTHGVLACLGDEDYPYAVPLTHVYFNNKIYFHSLKSGHMIDAITKNPKVSFSVVAEDMMKVEEYTTYYRSAIAFGKARIVEGDERIEAFEALFEKFLGDKPGEAIQKDIIECSRAYIIAIDVEHITGKQAIEYVNVKR